MKMNLTKMKGFLKFILQFVQGHLLKIDKQNYVLINETKGLKEQLIQISTENFQLKSKSDDLLLKNEELKVELVAVKSKSVELLKDTQQLKVELATVKSQSAKLLKDTEELRVELATVKSQSTQLLQGTEELKSKVEELKSHTYKIDLLIQSNEQIKLQSSKILDQIPQIQKSIVNLNEQIFPWLRLSEESSIIDDWENGEIQSLMEWIERKGEKLCELNLIYRGSRDGFTAKAFHSNCDNKSPTISIIKSVKNKIFGGYTEKTWEGNGYKNDDKAFLFSFTNKEKYPIKTPEDAIFANPSLSVAYGGGHDI